MEQILSMVLYHSAVVKSSGKMCGRRGGHKETKLTLWHNFNSSKARYHQTLVTFWSLPSPAAELLGDLGKYHFPLSQPVKGVGGTFVPLTKHCS